MSGSLSTSDAFWQQPVTKQLQSQLAQFDLSQQFVVACSGGRDSLSLARGLQLLCHGRVRVVHINHQLQVAAQSWAVQLQQQCLAWDLPCTVIAVQVERGNLEQQARQARYAALFNAIENHEVLALGHHQQDQAETMFMRLMSGSGLKGLSAMRSLDQRDDHQLWRPLLNCSRQQITDLAQIICPDYIDDPANQQDNFDRVFLRQHVWPVLKSRWSAIDTTLSRSAIIIQDSHDILQEVVTQDWLQCGDEQQLLIESLTALSQARQRLLLSRWMQGTEQYAPPFHLVAQIQALITAKIDAQPKIIWSNWQFRRFQNRVYRLADPIKQAIDTDVIWPLHTILDLPSGQWKWQQQEYGLSQHSVTQRWQLQARQGGEIFHLKGRIGRWPLKKSLQAAGIAPWQREQVHILWQDEQVYGILTNQGFWPVEDVTWVKSGWLPVRLNDKNH